MARTIGSAKGLQYRLPDGVRAEIFRLAASGMTAYQIAPALGVSRAVIHQLLAPKGWVIRREDWQVATCRLSLPERVEIQLGLQRGESCRSIARRIGRAPSTVCREVRSDGD